MDRSIDVHAERSAETRELIRRFAEMIRGIRTAMLTSMSAQGHLRSRPLATQQSELEDELWFYIDARSRLIDDIADHHQVNLAYVDSDSQRYVSVSGIGHVVRDPDLLRKFWNPEAARWFPDGPDRTPHLALLRIQVEEVEYWDQESASMVELFGFARSDERDVPPPGRQPPT
jgi:general stress protein 26